MLDRRAFIRDAVVCGGIGPVVAGCATVGQRSHPGGVAGYDYRRPGLVKGSRLVFLGDSITDMNWGRNESDRNHYLGHSYVYLIASRLGVDMAEAELEFFNRGVSGNTVGNLRSRWQKDAIEMKPDVLSILIGVNDVGRSYSAGEDVPLDRWEADYRSLLESSRQANADLRIVLLDPFVLRCGRLQEDAAWNYYRGQIDRLRDIVARLAEEYSAVHVRTQDVFDAAAKAVRPDHWIWDGVHPLPQGHELIARHWLQQVSARWRSA
jgi:lysophospholipase L1-like esterase